MCVCVSVFIVRNSVSIASTCSLVVSLGWPHVRIVRGMGTCVHSQLTLLLLSYEASPCYGMYMYITPGLWYV